MRMSSFRSRAWASTRDAIERINIELCIRNKLELIESLEAFFASGSLPLGKTDDAPRIASAELLEDRVRRAPRCCARCGRNGGSGWRSLDVVEADSAP